MTFAFFNRRPLTQAPSVIDAARGTAALLVLLSHADAYGLIAIPWDPHWRGMIGQAGVDLFFMLSGYLIWSSAERTLPSGISVYAVNRITRIAPLYLFSLIAVLALAPFFVGNFRPEPTLNNFVRHLFFTQMLEPSVTHTFNPVLWTLTHEALFYLIVPLIWLARRSLWLAAPLSLVALYGGTRDWFWIFDPFARMLFLFAIGMLLARYKLTPRWPTFAIALALFALGVGSGNARWEETGLAFAVFAGFSSLASAEGRMRPLLAPLAWVGVVSYSLYIWHYLLIELLGPHIARLLHDAGPFVTAAAFLTIALGVSWASYRFIEQPTMVGLRDRLLALLGHAKPAPVAPAPAQLSSAPS